ncbi:MAG: hypothetical protein JSU94_21890 [Phycisphaerales bacterium]|nr:MAG: hypothetical protein JSU94_21890 [Phycisphaerales bacterium]
MYDKRIKIFIALSLLMLMICLLRLVQMQLLPGSSVQDDIAELKRQRGLSRQLKTLRGRILDRNAVVLADDQPRFQIYIDYRLCSIFDHRVRKASLLAAAGTQRAGSTSPVFDIDKRLDAKLEDARNIIKKCARFGVQTEFIDSRINEINNRIWNLRTFLAWRRNNPDPNIIAEYKGRISEIPLSVAVRDFRKRYPAENKRLELIHKVRDIPEMTKSRPLLELETDNDVFTAQVEFMGVEGIEIRAKGERYYYFGPVASQTIGWVGPVTQKPDLQLFAGDRLASYLEGEVGGREDGVEYVCEAVLRGKRGEDFFDIDRQHVSHTETQFGSDVTLTLDIALQKRIEEHLANPESNLNHEAPSAAVVVDVQTGDILALVSLPGFDLNFVRVAYDEFAHDPCKPMINRAINKRYSPGSVAKPLILIAGLESGKITADEIIPCPALPAPGDWPDCWVFRRYQVGHTDWPNFARNAVKGSCNIYFSRLADRLDPLILQKWLFAFGYGRHILEPPLQTDHERNFRQRAGVISTIVPRRDVNDFSKLPPIAKREMKMFGIGQGNFRVTPLQVANAMAVIARKGIYKPPRLFFDDPKTSEAHAVNISISPQTLAVLYDGMHAVVNESGGTAYATFQPFLKDFAEQDVKIYGKTGSTEEPENAWFAGFVHGGRGRGITVALVVEGGESGSSDAAPLAREIIQFCIDAGYLGRRLSTETP